MPADPVAITADLIRCPSVTPAEGGALAYLERVLGGAGFTVHRMTFSAPGTPDVVNNYQFYLAERGYAQKHPKVIQALFEDSVEQGIWLKKNLAQAAAIIAPLQGLPADVVELALRRYEFNVKPITREVAAGQQRIADTFHELKLIPKPIKVSDAVLAAQP